MHRRKGVCASKSKQLKPRINITPAEFKVIAFQIVNWYPTDSVDDDRHWITLFQVTPEVVSEVWGRIGIDRDNPTIPEDQTAELKHLLWAILFLKTNSNDTDLAGKVGGPDGGVSETTFRKWKWIFIEKISYLETDVVSNDS